MRVLRDRDDDDDDDDDGVIDCRRESWRLAWHVQTHPRTRQ
jgi:hypothetical protein